MDIFAGHQIKGYEIQERIAAGGFGAVYRAYQSTIGREVAVKVILPSLANRPDFIRRFEAEAQIIARLEHMNIVPLYDYWRDPSGAYLVMRFLRGGSLYDHIRNQGALDIEATFNIFAQVAQGLHVAHRNRIIHRDIKPGNILLDEDSNGYVGDFGIAKDYTASQSITDPDSLIGSPEYLAPEQARSEPVTPQTDIYSLGVVLYELLMGQHPFPGVDKISCIYKHLNNPLPEVTTLDASICDDVNLIIQKATAKDPKQRFKDVIEMMQALRQATQLDTAPVPASIVELLTPREQEVMQLIIDGKSNHEISEALVITEATVKSYINNIYRKLKVRSRVQAIVRARDLNFVVKKPEVIVTTGYLPEPENPYKGLRAFNAADIQDFFGREKLTQKLLSRLQENGDHHHFLAVVGPSGSGKSSVVKAGLIPALWRGDLPGSEGWYIIDMLPGANPIDELEVALFQIATDKAMNIREQLERDTRGLIRAANMILPDDASELLVVIDQFEEVFTLVENEDERLHFLGLLREAVIEKRSRVRVVVTLRADYYDRPLQYPDFGNLMRDRVETVLPLSAEELERAIHEPANHQGITFEDGLVSRIVSDVHYQPGALPLLQYALTELFERRDGRKLTLEAYQEIGGSGGALANRADEIYLEGSNEGQELVRQLFLRLVTLGEGAEDTRRRVDRSELLAITTDTELMDEIIDLYTASRLLSLDNDPSTRRPTIEVAHEAILREWERLRGWLNQSREDIRQERLIAQATEAWKTHNRDKSYLLTGTRLEGAKLWRDSTELALTPLESEYIQTSVEEAKARELADAERQAHEKQLERRSLNFLRVLVGVLLLATLGAFGLTSVAVNSANEARNNFIASERIRLAAQAQIALDRGEDVRIPALLSIRSLELGYSPEADAALLQSLGRGFSQHVYRGHTNAISNSVLSPDGQYALTTSVNGTARLWHILSGEEIQRFTGHNGLVSGGVFLDDGRHILTYGADGTVRQWAIASGQEVRQFPQHEGVVLTLAVSHDSRFVLTSDQIDNLTGEPSGSAYLWDAATTELVHEFSGHSASINSVAFSPNDQYILTGSWDNTARLWDIATGNEIRRFEGHAGSFFTVEFSSDGNTFLSASPDSTVRLWDTNSGEELDRFVGHVGVVRDATFSPDNRYIVSAGADKTVRLWDVESGQEIRQFRGHTAAVSSVSITPDGRFILSTSGDNTARIWNIGVSTEPRIFRNPNSTTDYTNRVLMAVLSTTGETLVVANANGTIQVWDVASGQIIHELSDGLLRSSDIAISPDERLALASGGGDGIVRLWDIETGEQVQQFSGHMGSVWVVDFSADGRYIITGSSDSTARIWETQSGATLHELSGHEGTVVYAAAFSPDGRYIVTAGEDALIHLWDSETGEEIRRFAGHSETIQSVRFSPDGRLIVSGSEDSTVRLWDVETGRQLRQLIGHTLPVRTVTFSRNGSLIITGSDDQIVRIFETQTGHVIRQLVGHAVPVRSAHLSIDNQIVVTADVWQAYLWRFDLQDVIDVACAQLTDDLTAEERRTYAITDEDNVCLNNT